MATKAIDIATIFYAFYTLEKELFSDDWRACNQEQSVVLKLYQHNRDRLDKLRNLKSKVSIDWKILNLFLAENGFDEMFSESLGGIGVVSILDMFIKWLRRASDCEIRGQNQQNYIGFEISDCSVFLDGNRQVAQLKTKSGDLLWLTMAENETTEMDLLHIAFDAMAKVYVSDCHAITIKVPELEFDIKPNLDFLTGVGIQSQYISQVYQQFKLRINREGARVKVATGMETRMASLMAIKHLVFNRPFVGWMTQSAVPHLPIAIFYADYESWRSCSSKTIQEKEK